MAISLTTPFRVLRTGLLATAAVCTIAVLPSHAQQSSSSSNRALLAGEDIDGATLAVAPSPSPNPNPQYGGGYGGYSGYHEGKLSHVAIEAGGGFTAPLGNDVSGGFTGLVNDGTNYGAVTWGGNVLAGAGWNFSKRFAVLAEYAFNSNKIPGKTLSAVALTDGTVPAGGNVHTWSLTLEPMFYYMNGDKHKYGGYVIGGGGFYRKVTNFTEPVEVCEESYYYGVYCGYENQVAAHFSANAGGVNLGTGITYKLFGPDSHAKLFAEARYVFVNTPRYTGGNPETGTEELIPVTFGVRF